MLHRRIPLSLRFCSFVLFLVICVGLTSPAAALIDDSTSEGWVNASLQGTSLSSPQTTIQYVTNKMSEANLLINSLLDSTTTELNMNRLMTAYGTYLLCLDWLCSNVYTRTTTDGSDTVPDLSEQYSLYELPDDANGHKIYDRNEAIAEIEAANTLTEQIAARVTVSPSDNVLVTGSYSDIFNSIQGFLSGSVVDASQASTIRGQSALAGYTGYRDAVRSILRYYVDARTLSLLSKDTIGLEVIPESDTDISAQESQPSTEDIQDAANYEMVDDPAVATLDELANQIANKVEFASSTSKLIQLYEGNREISETLEVLSTFDLVYADLNKNMLDTIPAVPSTADSYCLGYELISLRAPSWDMTSGMSSLTLALYNHKKAATTESGDSTDLQPGSTQIITTPTDLSGDILQLLANAYLDNGTVVLQGDPNLTDLGYLVLSAGAIYDPFVSTAGNEGFVQTVEDSLSAGIDTATVLSLLQQAINSKKPLYVTKNDVTDWASADDLESLSLTDYRLATLDDALSININGTRAFAVIKGSMQPSTVDSSTWEYVVSNGASSSVSGVTVTDNNAAGVTRDTVTVGSAEFSGTGTTMSLPVLITSGHREAYYDGVVKKGYAMAMGGLTSLVLHNAAQDAKSNSYVQTPEKYPLFINGLGDIVLEDNTIVLPAIANPIIYNYKGGYDGISDKETVKDMFNIAAQQGSQSVTDSEDTLAYYPYTVAFMNHYPTGAINSEGRLSLTSTTDVDKYILGWSKGFLYAMRIDQINSNKEASISSSGVLLCAMIRNDSLAVESDPKSVYGVMTMAEGSFNPTSNMFSAAWNFLTSGVQMFVQYNYAGGLGGVADDENAITVTASNSDRMFVTRGSVSIASGGSLFPFYYATDLDESFLEIAGAMKLSAIRYISDDTEGTEQRKVASTFNAEHFILNMLGEGLLGTQYAAVYIKNSQMSYDEIVADSGGRLLNLFVQIADSAIDNLGTIDGVLAIKGPYENSFFNLIVNFVQQFYLIIALILIVIAASKFFKGHYNFLYVVFLSFVCVAGFEVYANWLPDIIPSLYNFAVNDTIEDVVWDTILYKAECYDETYLDADRRDTATGILKPYTATVTLYKLTRAEVELVSTQLGVDIDDIKSGRGIYLDSTAGIFLQGNEIRMSVDKLLVNNSMRGLYFTQWQQVNNSYVDSLEFIEPVNVFSNDNPYSVQLTSPYVSLEAYYTPFDHFERAFLIKLNNFSNIFRIERNSFSYDNGKLYKDAFLVRSYLQSGIVTAPGDDDVLRRNVDISRILGDSTVDADTILQLCHQYLDPQEDWLNLSLVFSNPDAGLKDSLWGIVLWSKGYYDNDWNVTPWGVSHLGEMIDYINTQTKIWVIDNMDNLEFASDENAIKLISLYATTCFTHYISEIGYWMYPNYINASNLELRDVLYGSMTSLRDRNFAYDGTVTNTVALNLGIFGIIFLLVIVLLATVFVFVVTYLVPILYCLFGGIIIFKLMNDEKSLGLIKGYMKVTLTTVILYLIFSLSIKIVGIGGYTWYGFLGCAVVMSLCVYFLFWTVLSVVQDMGELGNNTLLSNLARGFNTLTRDRFRQLTTQSLNVYRSYNNRMYSRGYNPFRRSYSMDDYDGARGSRYGYSSRFSTNRGAGLGTFRREGGFGCGRYDDYDDDRYAEVPSIQYSMMTRLGRAMADKREQHRNRTRYSSFSSRGGFRRTRMQSNHYRSEFSDPYRREQQYRNSRW